MSGVVVSSFGLKNNNCILTRRGEFVASVPESTRQLCCETGSLDLWVPFFGKSGNCFGMGGWGDETEAERPQGHGGAGGKEGERKGDDLFSKPPLQKSGITARSCL